MPYKSEKIKLPEKLDRRIKLDAVDKLIIKLLYGTFSQRYLAKMFNVSRRTIQFTGDPDKQKRNPDNNLFAAN